MTMTLRIRVAPRRNRCGATLTIRVAAPFAALRARRSAKRLTARFTAALEDKFLGYLETLPAADALARLNQRNQERVAAGLPPYKWQPVSA